MPAVTEEQPAGPPAGQVSEGVPRDAAALVIDQQPDRGRRGP